MSDLFIDIKVSATNKSGELIKLENLKIWKRLGAYGTTSKGNLKLSIEMLYELTASPQLKDLFDRASDKYVELNKE